MYNDTIAASVKGGRENGLDGRVLDIAGLLDRLASRRYIDDPGVEKRTGGRSTSCPTSSRA
jgi:hypothetical protein